MVDVPTVFR